MLLLNKKEMIEIRSTLLELINPSLLNDILLNDIENKLL